MYHASVRQLSNVNLRIFNFFYQSISFASSYCVICALFGQLSLYISCFTFFFFNISSIASTFSNTASSKMSKNVEKFLFVRLFFKSFFVYLHSNFTTVSFNFYVTRNVTNFTITLLILLVIIDFY